MTTLSAFDTPTLLDGLAAQQRRMVGIVAGLDDDTMRRPILPSGWSCAGMLQHLTGMTRFWFEAVMSGADLGGDTDDADDFRVAPDCRPHDLVDGYVAATARGHRLVRDLPLGTAPAWWPEAMFGPWRLHSLFEVLQHVLVETATHAGHLDAVRELIDGGTWDYERGQVITSSGGGPLA